MSKRDLKPCPFCGGKAKIQSYRVAEDAEAVRVKCTQCFAETDEFEDAYAPINDAVEAWNRRFGERTP
jgi:Lar family restriction alleviation protein